MRLFSDVASRVEDPFLSRAAALAVRGLGATAPNPLVGCVVVSGGRIVGEGFHPRAGDPHAEVFALLDAGPAARGATAYVTLEPCSHHGKTPPCTDALIAAGVERVVIGMRDPSAEASGGAEQLRKAGIRVEFARDPEPFAELNEGWLKRLATGAPFVTAKLGLSLDAHEAFRTGERSSITGVSGARVTRLLRAASDAVVVSAATVIADNPALTVRDADGQLAERQPLRVVLVRDTMPPESAAVFTDGLAETSVLTCGGALRGQDSFAGAAIVRSDDGDLSDVFGVLGRLGLGEVLLEPGPRLFTALWEVGALDQLVTVTCAGCAGAGAPALFSGAPDCEGNSLVSRMKPVEAGIVLDVSVTAWRPLTPTREP